MGIATAVISSADDYQRALDTSQPVFMLFVSPQCPACGAAVPLFERVAGSFTAVIKSIVLDTSQTPRHPDVTGTPTLLIFQNGELVEKLKGFGPLEAQEQTVKGVFARYAPDGRS